MKKRPSSQAFALAVVAGEIDRVREMRAAGASVGEPGQYGRPVHRAATHNHEEIIRLLLKWGSPLEPRGTERWTPVPLASVSMSPEAVAQFYFTAA